MKYLLIDYVLNISCICDSKENVIESLGYDVDEITFEEAIERVDGEYEILEIKD